ncbi:glycosyltransferase family 4 protein [Candidatus Uhrbacteria bacterium]|nr:glycosyltransferase family 4 protein [Candidatus Uhrbacteria bacterium]
MLIGIDASRTSKKEKTGVEWYAYHLLRAMRKLPSAHSFRLYTRDPLPFSMPPAWEERVVAWPFPLLWTQGGLSMEMLRHAPDILFVPSSALPFILPRRSVTTIHDVGFLQERSYRSARELSYLDWSTRFAVNHATKVIAVSEFTKRELVRLYDAPPEKIVVVHEAHAHAVPFTEEAVQEIRRTHQLTRPYLLFVSRIDSRKNVGTLIEAFRLLKKRKVFDGDLALVGPLGFDGADIIRQGGTGAYGECIRHLGWISEMEKNALLQAAVAFVFPSLYEGFGMVILEAQSRGVPVICSNTTSLPEVAGRGAYGIDPNDPESVAAGVSAVLQDSELRHTLVMRGRENAKNFSWDRAARETLEVFEQAANTH